MPPREVEFQQDFAFLLKSVVQRRHEFQGIRFEDVRMEFPVADGRADIALLLSGGRPFVLIETKRKNGAVQKDIDPLSPRVIRQALGYAAIAGSPYFATANRGYLAVFRRPRDDEEFRIEKHRVLITTITALSEEFASKVIETVVSYHRAATDQDRARVATGLDWTFIIRLRSFVDWLSRRIEPAVLLRLSVDAEFQGRARAFEKETGTKVEAPNFARQMAYILTNKIVFHKVLERSYPLLDRLGLNDAHDAKEIIATLDQAFADAVDVTGNFEAIFSAGLYDEVVLADDMYDLLDISEGVEGFIEDMGTYRLEELEADVIGHVYESLIPDEDRHRLGQFYTPPAVAEFLVRWAVRSSDDIVLDPAAGSGTFLVKAYQRLRDLNAESGIRGAEADRHRKLLSQLYALDINPFPAHLTAMNLAMRDVRHPVTEMNILERDFFKVSPGSVAYVPYVVRTATGDQRRQIRVPLVDALVANPPYTRWMEIPDSSREAIQARLGRVLQKYGLTAVIRGGVETAIYHHFVLHGCDFLKEGGRLAMILSSSWLQTDVGIKFASFLLDHFKIHAVIDIGPRIFAIPIAAYCLILMERCADETARQSTKALFAYLDNPISVDDLTGLLSQPKLFEDRLQVRFVEQNTLPRDRKWIEVLFGFAELNEKIRSKTIELRELFEVTRGTIQYCAEGKRGLGANDFFYFDGEKARQWGVPDKYLAPSVSSSRYVVHFEFRKNDWRELKRDGALIHVLHAREPKTSLPSSVKEYIRWGETDCRTKDDATCSKSQACSERERKKDKYRGWYDIGEIRSAKFITSYYARYLRKFCLLGTKLALDSDFICFSPKVRLTETQTKAILACLNSSLGQAYIELTSRTSGGVVVGMEIGHAQTLRVPDVRSLPQFQVTQLANSFDALESKSRAVGGVNQRDSISKLEAEIKTADKLVATSMGLTRKDVERLSGIWSALRERRLARASEPAPETLRGADRTLEGPPRRKRSRSQDQQTTRTLDEFEKGNG